MQKAMKEIARDVEFAILTNATKTAGDAATAGQLGGIKYWNDANVTDMETAALTEPKFNDAIQKAWEAGGTPGLVICSGKNKRVISGFTAGSQKTKAMEDKKLVQVVEIYESDFGIVKMQAHRMQTNDRIDILETQYWKIAYLIPFKTEDLPRVGLKVAKNIHGQLTLECRTKEAHASIINIA